MTCAAQAYDSNTSNYNSVGKGLFTQTLINYLSNMYTHNFLVLYSSTFYS